MTSTALDDDLAQAVHAVLDRHFIAWRQLDAQAGPAAEWYCGCGLKFGFSDTAVAHQVDEVTALITNRLAAAGSDALIDAARDLDRLNTIGNTRRDLVTDDEWEWFSSHPLQRANTSRPLSSAIPPLTEWLRERAGDEQ